MKKIFFIIILLFIFLNLFSQDKINLKIGSAYPRNNEATIAALKFSELAEKYSKGRITCRLFYDGIVGGDIEILQAVRSGALDISVTGMIPVNQYAKEYGFLNFPYIFRDYRHFRNVWESNLGQNAKDLLINNNLHTIGHYYRGYRLITSNKPIKKVEDMKGLKIRIPQNPGWDKVFKFFNATVFVFGLPELYASISSGIAEASEGPASQIDSYKLYEVQKYLILSEHLLSVGIMCINENVFKKFGSADKALIEKAALEAVLYASDYAMNSEKEIIQKLERSGMILISPDKESFRARIKKYIDELFKSEWSVTGWDAINKM